ncbi:MAG TPA: PTS glucitol/sorbitol transporter subunit IIA [Ktedonobacteraceae bacterium]|nr:PTS glucitol/sorbitol transporter subunit IIA [Ktedonobacteraceae bacterium]
MVAHSLKYRGVIQEIGSTVHQFLQFLPYEMLIFFGESAPAELRALSLIHNGTQLASDLAAGDYLKFSPPSGAEKTHQYRLTTMGETRMVDTDTEQPQWYRLTAVGEKVNANLVELGHVVVHFDGATTANVPGAVSVEPALEALPTIGTTFEFFGLKE